MTRGRQMKNKKSPSMDAYGNLTLGMAIQMQFESICLFVTKQRQRMQMNEWPTETKKANTQEKFHKNG